MSTQDRLAVWSDECRQVGFRHRNWRIVRLLSALASFLLLAGLPAEFLFGLRQLADACWIAGGLAGTAMLIWFFDERLFIKRPPAAKP